VQADVSSVSIQLNKLFIFATLRPIPVDKGDVSIGKNIQKFELKSVCNGVLNVRRHRDPLRSSSKLVYDDLLKRDIGQSPKRMLYSLDV